MNNFLLAVICLFTSLNSHAQQSTYPDDVKDIDAIINAYYDVVSGSAEDPWEYDRDAYLHDSDAMIIRIDDLGNVAKRSLADEYMDFVFDPRTPIYEIELGRKVHEYGNIAHVWSTYEVRDAPDGNVLWRGVNSIELYFSRDRWWISSWTTQREDGTPIPTRYLTK